MAPSYSKKKKNKTKQNARSKVAPYSKNLKIYSGARWNFHLRDHLRCLLGQPCYLICLACSVGLGCLICLAGWLASSFCFACLAWFSLASSIFLLACWLSRYNKSITKYNQKWSSKYFQEILGITNWNINGNISYVVKYPKTCGKGGQRYWKILFSEHRKPKSPPRAGRRNFSQVLVILWL